MKYLLGVHLARLVKQQPKRNTFYGARTEGEGKKLFDGIDLVDTNDLLMLRKAGISENRHK